MPVSGMLASGRKGDTAHIIVQINVLSMESMGRLSSDRFAWEFGGEITTC